MTTQGQGTAALHPTTAGDVLANQGFEAWLREAGVSLVLASRDGARMLAVGLEEDGERIYSCEVTGANACAVAGAGPVLWAAGRGRIARFQDGPPVFVQGIQGPAGYYPRRVSFFGQSVARVLRLDPGGTPWLATTHRTCSFAPNGVPVPAAYPEAVTGSKAPPIPLEFKETGVKGDAAGGTAGGGTAEGAPAYAPSLWHIEREEHTALLSDAGEVAIAGPRVWAITPHEGAFLGVRPSTCEVGRLSREGEFTPLALVPGAPSGLLVLGGYALVTTSGTVSDEAALARLKEKDIEPRTSVTVIELATGRAAHWLRWLRVVDGISAITTLPNPRPILVGITGV